jgi:hypothetical protein
MMRAVLIGMLLLTPAQAQQPPKEPYSCRLLDDEERKCGFDPHCNQRVVERLKRECLRDRGSVR